MYIHQLRGWPLFTWDTIHYHTKFSNFMIYLFMATGDGDENMLNDIRLRECLFNISTINVF